MLKRTHSEKVLLSLSFLATITISPFVVLRWLNGDISLAIIDGITSLASISFFMFIYITRKIETAQKLFAVFLATAVLTTIYIKGESQVLWTFPAIITIFYLMPLKMAKVASAILVLLLLIIIYPKVNLVSFFSVLATTTLTTMLSFVMFRSHHEKENELSQLASIDSLTSSGNRRALDQKLFEVIASQQREAYTMCLILIDLDRFKDINDDHGHAIGDQILQNVSELMTSHTRVLDEFIIVPLNMSLETTRRLAEKIRDICEQHKFVNDIKLTLSIGVAEYKAHDTPESWISRADEALYKAKENGRNNVC